MLLIESYVNKKEFFSHFKYFRVFIIRPVSTHLVILALHTHFPTKYRHQIFTQQMNTNLKTIIQGLARQSNSSSQCHVIVLDNSFSVWLMEAFNINLFGMG